MENSASLDPAKPSAADWAAEALSAIENSQVRLPGLPALALRVHQAVSDPDCTPAGLAYILGDDVSIGARVIKVANSASARRAVPVTRLDRAVMRLGLSLVRSLLVGLCLLRRMERHEGPMGEWLRQHHAHTIEVASRARVIAAAIPHLDAEEALLAGLVHDVGVLPLLDFAAARPALQQSPEQLESLLETLHPEVGARVLHDWQLPESLVEVARGHENLDRRHSGPVDYLDVVIAANFEARLAAGDPQLVNVERSQVPALERLGRVGNEDEADDAAQAVGELRSALAG